MRTLTAKLGAASLLAIGGVALLANSSTHAEPAAASVPITGTWSVDPMHTNINFAVRHLGISVVRGRFDDFSGAIQADGEHPEKSSVQFAIQANSIDTMIKMRDDDLRSAKYFDTAKFPQITFQSTSVQRRKGGFVARGNLTIHGVTKEISLPFRVAGPVKDPYGGTHIGVETEVHLKRLDFGVGNDMKLGNGEMAIGNDIDVTIGLEAVPPKP